MDIKIHNFTLTEALLITFGILLLAAMFLPALSMKRETTYSPRCTNSLKQIGLGMRMYSQVYNEAYPHLNGRSGLQLLATEGFLENTRVYICPSTRNIVTGIDRIHKFSSYAYAGGLTEATSVDSGLASDRANNHEKFGNILFTDGHVKGYAGSSWSASRGGSHLTDFK